MKQTVHIRTEQEKYDFIQKLAKWNPVHHPYTITFSEYKDSRTLEQNKKMWAMLTDISEQVMWCGKHHSKEDWKDLMTAALKMTQREELQAVPGIGGNYVVVLGLHTSSMTLKAMSDLIEYMYSWGSELEPPVEWSEDNVE